VETHNGNFVIPKEAWLLADLCPRGGYIRTDKEVGRDTFAGDFGLLDCRPSW